MRKAVQILLTAWDDDFGQQNGRALLADWNAQPFAKRFTGLLEDREEHKLLLKSFIRDIDPFDCLLIADWRPSENTLSDVIAALLNPDWGHPLKNPLSCWNATALRQKVRKRFKDADDVQIP